MIKKISVNWFFTIFIVLFFLVIWVLKAKQVTSTTYKYYEFYAQNYYLYEILGYILSLFWTIPAVITNISLKKELTRPIKIVTSIVAISSIVITLSPFIPYIDFLTFPLMMTFLYSWILFPAYYLLTIFVIKYKTKKLNNKL